MDNPSFPLESEGGGQNGLPFDKEGVGTNPVPTLAAGKE